MMPYNLCSDFRVFKLVQPTPHLRPEKIEVKSATEEISPFVYTPFVTNRNKDLPDNSKAGMNLRLLFLHYEGRKE